MLSSGLASQQVPAMLRMYWGWGLGALWLPRVAQHCSQMCLGRPYVGGAASRLCGTHPSPTTLSALHMSAVVFSAV
jgi:hypothetical protein